jgi:predicted transcriptional regulator
MLHGEIGMSNWTLFSNHGHVLVCLSRDSEVRLRDVAADVGITERAVQKIVRDLQDGGMVSVTKNGRRNSYYIHKNQSLRHKLEAACTLKDLIKIVNKDHRPKDPVVNEATDTEKPLIRNTIPGDYARSSTSPTDSGSRSIPVPPAEPEKEEDPKPEHSDSEERQQGSLF